MLCNNGYGKGYGFGYGHRDGYGYGHGDRYGDGKGVINGDGDGDGAGFGYGKNGNGNGRGDPHPTNKLSAMAVPEDPACTRLLTNRYPDINFYICQLQLMRGKQNE